MARRDSFILITIGIALFAAFVYGDVVEEQTESFKKVAADLPNQVIGRDGAPMVLIAAGEFEMGSNDGNVNEKPVHTVYLDNFYMDVYEVTNELYKRFLDANPQWRKDQIEDELHDGDYLKDWNGSNYPVGKRYHPVIWIFWYAARAYAEWAGKRLPTEAEWEKAARGGLVAKQYPWGNDISHDYANYRGSGGKDRWNGTAPVGRFVPNGYGLYDMAGNVWEWCADWYDSKYYARSPRENPKCSSSGQRRVLRGGSWYLLRDVRRHSRLRVAYRFPYFPKATHNFAGFRCAMDETMDETMKTQDVPIRISFEGYSDHVLPEIISGIDMESTGKPRLMPRPEASAQWSEGNLQAGKSARLEVTVRNTGKGQLFRVTASTTSPNPAFNDQKLEFGRIDPGKSVTRVLSFETDGMMQTQDIPVRISFEEYNDWVPPDIDAKLHVVGKPRPKFDYAYRILDGETPNSVGNGDGIIQRNESVDIVVTVRNSGAGPANGVTTKLNLLDKSGVEMFTDSSVEMGDIAAGNSKTVTFNVGVKSNASVKLLRMDLSITDDQFGDEVKLTNSIKLPIDQKIAPKIVVVDLVGTVVADPANLHSGADSETSVLAQIPQHSFVRITGELGDWFRIKLKELTGWINAEQITPQKITAPMTSSQLPEPTVIKVFQRMPPQLTLVAPERDQIAINTETITLFAVATDDEGIKNIELMVNGKSVEGRGFRSRKTGTPQKIIKIKETIPLSYGGNQIKLVAFDTDNQRSEPMIVNVTRTRKISELWIISIGISNYQHVTKLRYADEDAQAIADYFRSIGVPSDHIRILLDEDATVGAIRQAFGELMGKAKEEASVVIYFSGHGAPASNPTTPDGDGIDKYLLTFEADPDNLYGTALPMDDIAGIFKRLASDRVVFIADTCYSGAAGGKTILAKNMTGSRATPDYERFLSRLAVGKGRVILTASRGNELSHESPKLKHGIFTYVLLKALHGSADRNGDGFITFNEVCDYVAREVPNYGNQHPMWKGEASGDLVIGRAK